jgi:ATP-dependent Clp protease ATP-binding subunit ClpA
MSRTFSAPRGSGASHRAYSQGGLHRLKSSGYALAPTSKHSPDVQTEHERLQRNKVHKRRLEEAKHELEAAQHKGDYEAALRLPYATIPELEISPQMAQAQTPCSTSVLCRTISSMSWRATGIPVQSLLKGERERLSHVRGLLSFLQ